ncbi:hypothetical protein F4779DRAFT_353489 [Xylariaceae sp. FL0662B]|nr:hypothetical protein F4779DRAFT_353489 [Xylariaceae sp. FL0662B]
MAVISDQLSSELNKRQRSCPDGYYLDRGLCYSAWNWYGRWVFAAGIIVVIIVIAFLWACVRARRRRRVGAQPLYGTGWMAGK